jgi:hypothetical protein
MVLLKMKQEKALRYQVLIVMDMEKALWRFSGAGVVQWISSRDIQNP